VHRTVLADVVLHHPVDSHLTERVGVAQDRAQKALLELVVELEYDSQARDLGEQRCGLAFSRIELVGQLLAAIDQIADLIVLVEELGEYLAGTSRHGSS
jgi:hypothetical protein